MRVGPQIALPARAYLTKRWIYVHFTQWENFVLALAQQNAGFRKVVHALTSQNCALKHVFKIFFLQKFGHKKLFPRP